MVFPVSDSLPQFDFAASRYILKSSAARVSKISDGLYFKYRFQPEVLIAESEPVSVLRLAVTAIVCFGCTFALCGEWRDIGVSRRSRVGVRFERQEHEQERLVPFLFETKHQVRIHNYLIF